ncbi:hypothetical protein FXN63_09680 [Pigmentiphaga aceris]|uniref:Uncharacterized protein n=1 Tax=Pigmentiphaga aceris TaxID=1940612 RepID=A0A5C0AV62_9BURK|nr:hypothetical protein [Pigmentiphaga aceris]QEI06075.1 hypothetical protein FXN63_09680 [Pigmentiphaga aceris]
MTRAQRDFSYPGTGGATYGVRVILDRNAETGMYSGHAEIYRGEVENSAFLSNDVTISPFVAASRDHALNLAYEGACAQIDQFEWIARDVNV